MLMHIYALKIIIICLRSFMSKDYKDIFEHFIIKEGSTHYQTSKEKMDGGSLQAQ